LLGARYIQAWPFSIIAPRTELIVPISDTDKQQLRTELLHQRTSLLAALKIRLHHGDDPADMALSNFYEVIDNRAEAGTLTDTDIAQLNHETAELEQLDGALARMDDGSYGQCSACGEAITLARLRAQPMAALCIDCQQKAERQR
jgi:DnaK suppressor protein